VVGSGSRISAAGAEVAMGIWGAATVVGFVAGAVGFVAGAEVAPQAASSKNRGRSQSWIRRVIGNLRVRGI
jgi:uncharacterized membrane protein